MDPMDPCRFGFFTMPKPGRINDFTSHDRRPSAGIGNRIDPVLFSWNQDTLRSSLTLMTPLSLKGEGTYKVYLP